VYYDFKQIFHRNKFIVVQTKYLQEQFEKYKLNNPSYKLVKLNYWNFETNDLFQNLNAFEYRLNCIKV